MFELTTLVAIGIDCIGSYKSNYYTIMTTMAPPYSKNMIVISKQFSNAQRTCFYYKTASQRACPLNCSQYMYDKMSVNKLPGTLFVPWIWLWHYKNIAMLKEVNMPITLVSVKLTLNECGQTTLFIFLNMIIVVSQQFINGQRTCIFAPVFVPLSPWWPLCIPTKYNHIYIVVLF